MSDRSDSIARFPPLARIPTPPEGSSDPRQRRTQAILGNISAQVPGVVQVNTRTGFRAAAVDVGRLQELLEAGLARLEEPQVKERWDELQPWMSELICTWVQRVKMLRIELRELGVRIEMKTQDDFGYYDFAFDVFPSRAIEARKGHKG